MALLKEDGSLDVERIDSLPLWERVKEIESLNPFQFKEYESKKIIKETREPVRIIEVDYGFDDIRSGVDAEEFLNNLDAEDDGR